MGTVRITFYICYRIAAVDKPASAFLFTDMILEFVVNEIAEDGTWNKLLEVDTGRHLTGEEFFERVVGHSPLVQELMKRESVEQRTQKQNCDLNSTFTLHLPAYSQPVQKWKILNRVCARELSEIMPQKDVVSWNAMITGYAKCGSVDEARELFDRMPLRNVISYAKCGSIDKARELFDKFSQRDVI